MWVSEHYLLRFHHCTSLFVNNAVVSCVVWQEHSNIVETYMKYSSPKNVGKSCKSIVDLPLPCRQNLDNVSLWAKLWSKHCHIRIISVVAKTQSKSKANPATKNTATGLCSHYRSNSNLFNRGQWAFTTFDSVAPTYEEESVDHHGTIRM